MIQYLVENDVRVPEGAGFELDERLLSILYKAIARDPQQRIATAAQLREALDAYQTPEEPVAAADARQSTVEFLLRRMRHRSDFPALSDSVSIV